MKVLVSGQPTLLSIIYLEKQSYPAMTILLLPFLLNNMLVHQHNYLISISCVLCRVSSIPHTDPSLEGTGENPRWITVIPSLIPRHSTTLDSSALCCTVFKFPSVCFTPMCCTKVFSSLLLCTWWFWTAMSYIRWSPQCEAECNGYSPRTVSINQRVMEQDSQISGIRTYDPGTIYRITFWSH